jgi:hypothetical protein
MLFFINIYPLNRSFPGDGEDAGIRRFRIFILGNSRPKLRQRQQVAARAAKEIPRRGYLDRDWN